MPLKKDVVMKMVTYIAVVLIVGTFVPSLEAQGTVYVSNLGQAPMDSMEIGSDSWIAQEFWLGSVLDTDRNLLTSVQLLLNAASGNPSGFQVSIYSPGNNGTPGSLLGHLNGSADPSSHGTYTYTSSGIVILPGEPYFVVVTAATPIAQGAYDWSAANGITGNPNTGWTIQDDYYSSANGSSWTETIRRDVFQMAIYAEPIPEPSALSFIYAGGVVLIYLRARKRFC